MKRTNVHEDEHTDDDKLVATTFERPLIYVKKADRAGETKSRETLHEMPL